MVPFIIHLDSSYIGFMFLLVTELFLIRVVVTSHVRNLDMDVKRCLDDGDRVKLDIREFGPLKVASHMTLSKMIMMILPPFIILSLFGFAELGISGTTVPTYAEQNTILLGKYFALDSVVTQTTLLGEVDYSPNPNLFDSFTSNCIYYNEDSSIVTGRVATISYEVNTTIRPLDVYCSTEDDIIVSYIGGDVRYNVTSLGDLIYFAASRDIFLGFSNGDARIYMGTSSITTDDRFIGYNTNTFWVENSIDGSTSTCAILDVSGNSTSERWLLNPTTTRKLDNILSYTSILVECDEGCFEAISQWCLLDRKIGMENIGDFFSIWYEGLNYGTDEISPKCERIPYPYTGASSSSATNVTWLWGDDYGDDYGTISPTPFHFEYRKLETSVPSPTPFGTPPFKTGSCDEAVSRNDLPDGGVENVTEISIWAASFVIIGVVLAFIHYMYSREGGYDLLSYEGISKVCYMDANPGHVWDSSGTLSVSIVDGVVSSKDF